MATITPKQTQSIINADGNTSTVPPGLAPAVEPLNDPTNYRPGSGIIRPDVPGDLGTIRQTFSQALFAKECFRSNSSENILVATNHRYRGHRESNKFNLNLQSILCTIVKFSEILRSKDSNLNTRERTYPTDDDLSKMNHIREQLRYIEWALLKDTGTKWFF